VNFVGSKRRTGAALLVAGLAILLGTALIGGDATRNVVLIAVGALVAVGGIVVLIRSRTTR
jgi:hypothetical protein